MGIYLDVFYYYYLMMDKGKFVWMIDEIFLDWCYGDGVVLDFLDKLVGIKLIVKDFEEVLFWIDYELKEKDIVLIWIGVD